MIRNLLDAQTYNDGVVRIYAVDDISEPGDIPKEGLKIKETLRYKRRTVGIQRYYTALQANAQIEQVLRCQLRENVSSQDVAVVNGTQYRIEQVQYPEDLPVMDLSLSRMERDYDVASG